MLTIPMADLQAQHHAIRAELDEAIGRALDNAHFILGPEVAAFESEFARYQGAEQAIAVNSGTSALHLALLAAGAGEGDEVITTPFTFIATAAAIRYVGAKPVFVDIDPVSFNMDPARVEAAISPRTRAILPVHLYGQPAEMDAITAIAQRHKLTVIEDAAQAHGAEYHGKRVGTIGDIGCFSFYPAKNLGACGEGGAVVTNDPEHSRTVKLLRDWGSEKKYVHSLHGFNYRMEGLQGAILRVKLRHLEAWTEARIRHAAMYAELLAGSSVGLPRAAAGVRHVWHCYTIRVAARDQVQSDLLKLGVQTGVHYPIPIHQQPAYEYLGYGPGAFPEAERAAAEVLAIPIHAELTGEQIRRVSDCIHQVMPARV